MTRSPLLFTCVLEEVFKNLNWEEKGIKVNGKYLNNLRFAENLCHPTSKNFMIKDFDREGEKAGLKININKSVIMSPL